MTFSRDFKFLVDNIILPPQLPHTDDEECGSNALLEACSQATGRLATLSAGDARSEWAQITTCIKGWAGIYEDGTICESKLMKHISHMRNNDFLALYIRSQNAGVLLRKTTDGSIFESFEVSPKTDDVMGAESALQRTFPARAVLVPNHVMDDDTFLSELSSTLQRLSVEQLKHTMESSHKAGNMLVEERQSCHPSLVTEWLFGVLLCVGQATSARTVVKRTRDDVCWKDALRPWRRSPLWLTVRVGLQLKLANSTLADQFHSQYKSFMCVLIARLAKDAAQENLSLDILHVITAKLARRTAKISHCISSFVQDEINESIRKVRSHMEHEWEKVQRVDTTSVKAIPSADQIHLGLHLSRASNQLQKILVRSRQLRTCVPSSFKPNTFFRTHSDDRSIPPVSSLLNAAQENRLASLKDVEDWTSAFLQAWSQRPSRTEAECKELNMLITAYHQVAATHYRGVPEQMSMMLLTIVDLWCALDTIAISIHPLLGQYYPEIPISLLEPLLLPQVEDLARLHRLEEHLATRYTNASYTTVSVFGPVSSDSLGVRFFDQAQHLQASRTQIEAEASEKREKKQQEFERLREEYDRTMKRVNSMECGTFTTWRGRTVHARGCHRCSLRKSAERMQIVKHEWPLPSNEVACKAAMFELNTPEAITAWRDATWMVLTDLSRSIQATRSLPVGELFKYAPLASHCTQTSRRIAFASTTKSFYSAHYKISRRALDDVLVNHGMQYSLYDTSKKAWTAEQGSAPSVRVHCKSKIPDGSYTCLTDFVNSTSNSSNDVIARQAECSPALSIHEFLAFGMLRSGERLQLLNIYRELKSSSINFNSPEVVVLLQQAVWQAGTRSQTTCLREAHVHLEDYGFCVALLEALELYLRKIEANWKEVCSASALLLLGLRVLSLTNHEDIVKRALSFIHNVRRVSLDWIGVLLEHSHQLWNSGEDINTQDARDAIARVLDAGLLCRMTWNVDGRHLGAVLSNGTELSEYVYCSIIIHDHQPTQTESLSWKLKGDLLRDKKLALALERRLYSFLVGDTSSITQGVNKIWDGANFRSPWEYATGSDTPWMMNNTDERSQPVHYNLISGALLVSGRPLSRLPPSYTCDDLYGIIFGSRVLEVVTSDMPDMAYMTAKSFAGHQIYFGMLKSTLVIKSRYRSCVYQAVARENFRGDLPSLLIENSVQWINLADGNVEFRSNANIWKPSTRDWTLFFHEARPFESQMRINTTCLLDDRSPHGISVHSLFKNFEKPAFVHILWTNDGELEVELPRFRLKFFATSSGMMECRELSAVVDKDQNFGTLHGLRRRLVLRSKGSSAKASQRFVLIPYGKVSLSGDGLHVSAGIETQNSTRLSYFRYDIDAWLGQLQTDGKLESHLFKAYLHAVTSSVLPDSLTNRTGTMESLACLTDTITKTTIPLSKQAQNILHALASLTPVRSYYPRHLKKMQHVEWSSVLSPLSQHDCFSQMVRSIVDQNRSCNFLFSESSTSLEQYAGDLPLLHRSWSRNHKNYPIDSLVLDKPVGRDIIYQSRDRNKSASQAAALEMAATIKLWPLRLKVDNKLYSMFLRWQIVSGFQDTFSCSAFSELLSLSLSEQWPSLYRLCRMSAKDQHLYHLMFTFSATAFGNPGLKSDLRTLFAFACNDQLKRLPPVTYDTYDLTKGNAPSRQEVISTITSSQKPFVPNSTSEPEQEKERADYEKSRDLQCDHASEVVMGSWPQKTPTMPDANRVPSLDHASLRHDLTAKFNTWYKNHCFSLQVQEIEAVLAVVNCDTVVPAPASVAISHDSQLMAPSFDGRLDLLDVVDTTDPAEMHSLAQWQNAFDGNLKNAFDATSSPAYPSVDAAAEELQELEELVRGFSEVEDRTSRAYGEMLLNSINALCSNVEQIGHQIAFPEPSKLLAIQRSAQQNLHGFLRAFKCVLGPRTRTQENLQRVCLWPQVTYLSLLQLLSTGSRAKVPDAWIAKITSIAKEFTAVQRVARLIHYSTICDTFALTKEINNEGHDAWNVAEYPEWLLLEIRNNFLIRPIQVHVAKQLLIPSNSILQLGMGEGKTSVILPMVITALANGRQLVRVVVLKPLANQMHHLLSARLSGLVDRAVYQLPFSRKTKLNKSSVTQLSSIYHNCLTMKGVILTLPEYLNSFRLVGVDSLTGKDSDLSGALLRMQTWLDKNARDILDESDELLSPAYELVYSVGEQKVLDQQPDRWLVTQEVLSLIQRHAAAVHQDYPEGLDYLPKCSASFPQVRILSEQGGSLLMGRVVADIVTGSLPGISLGHCGHEVREAAKEFISQYSVRHSTTQILRDHFGDSPQLANLYLLRGLVAHRVLQFALRKRWLVSYGLDRSRCLSAVPYRAKCTPSPSAEFSQPDVMVVLTALSYYYTGLSREDVRDCAIWLLKMSDPDDEFARWINGTTLPSLLRSVNAINLDDQTCLDQFYDHLRFSKTTIDFFLRQKVYPREAKEFKLKLSSSAWDLCSYERDSYTSGFSGTNDNKSLLPLSVYQKDLPELLHTSAIVLVAMLQKENRMYLRAADSNGHRLSTSNLLDMIIVQQPSPSVLIDVGAQVLDLNNHEVAAEWLRRRTDKQAAIFFNENNETMVLDRNGDLDRWHASPFRDRLGECLVYLDEFHTRGTDFTLPDGFRAAVILGPLLTKDRLTQACMRMRKLGHSQSILFLSPPEVDRSIRSLMPDASCVPCSADIIRWTMHETCSSIKNQRSLWVVRGLAHGKRRLARQTFLANGMKHDYVARFLRVLQEQESWPVIEMYKALSRGSKHLPYEFDTTEQQDLMIGKLLKEWQNLDADEVHESDKQGEQERELRHEVEQEREVQRPMSLKACLPKLSKNLVELVQTGSYPGNIEDEQTPAFLTLYQTSTGGKIEGPAWPRALLVTRDFQNTVQMVSTFIADDFLRPVNWVISRKNHPELIILSPFEANALLPEIRKSNHIALHIYFPRISKSMHSFSQLSDYSISATPFSHASHLHTFIALNIFAGQLYFENHVDYRYLCKFLGLLDGMRELKHEHKEVYTDGFVSPACREVNDWKAAFSRSPIPFIKDLMGMRRKGNDFLHTHIGRIVSARILKEEDI